MDEFKQGRHELKRKLADNEITHREFSKGVQKLKEKYIMDIKEAKGNGHNRGDPGRHSRLTV